MKNISKIMDQDKLPINWNAGETLSKKQSSKAQQLELKIKSLADSTTIKLNIDSNNPNIRQALEDAKQAMEDAKENMNDVKREDMQNAIDELDDELNSVGDDNFYSHEHYIFRMMNGELVALD